MVSEGAAGQIMAPVENSTRNSQDGLALPPVRLYQVQLEGSRPTPEGYLSQEELADHRLLRWEKLYDTAPWSGAYHICKNDRSRNHVAVAPRVADDELWLHISIVRIMELFELIDPQSPFERS